MAIICSPNRAVGTPGAAPRRSDHRQPGRYPSARVPPGLPPRAAGCAAHHVWGQRGVQRRGRRGAGKVAGAEVGHVQGESEVGTLGGLERFGGKNLGGFWQLTRIYHNVGCTIVNPPLFFF